MKKITTFITATLMIATFANATVRTVNNNGLSGAQYTDIPAAITASSNGDTIYVSGSTTTYSNFTVYKRLTIIGPGTHIGGGTQNTQAASVSTITIDSTAINQSASYVKLVGLSIASAIYINQGKNITIERCQFSSLSIQNTSSYGLFIRGCAFDNMSSYSGNTNNSIEISNCIYKFSYGLTPNSIVNHCVIIGQGWNNYYYYVNNGAVFTNNIFYNTDFDKNSPTGCVFTNNLVYNITKTAFTLPLSGNTGNNNQAAVDPLFVNPSTPNNTTPYWYDFMNYNWRLQAASPGNNKASDGTDLGIYGGGLAMNETGLIPAIPQVHEINIGNAAVPQNGTLNVTFKARKQN